MYDGVEVALASTRFTTDDSGAVTVLDILLVAAHFDEACAQ